MPVADPERWLEDGESPEVVAWAEEQDARARAAIGAWPERPRLAARLRELFAIGSVGAPAVRRGRYFHEKRRGDEQQPLLLVRATACGATTAS